MRPSPGPRGDLAHGSELRLQSCPTWVQIPALQISNWGLHATVDFTFHNYSTEIMN